MVAIPKDAENVEAAYKFMDFLMQPEVMAGITNAVRFPNGNKAATALVDKEITSDPSIYPPADVKKSCTRSPTRVPKHSVRSLAAGPRSSRASKPVSKPSGPGFPGPEGV